MQKIFLMLVSFLAVGAVAAADLPQWASPLAYEQIGSCSDHNLGYNASRFNGISLEDTRDNYDLYLQFIIYLKNDGAAYVRTQEVGLIECKDTPDGQFCTHWPYVNTRKYITTTWKEVDESIVVDNIGTITKIRDDFPWLGYNIKVSELFSVEKARNAESIGGKVQVNFDEHGVNTATTCKDFN